MHALTVPFVAAAGLLALAGAGKLHRPDGTAQALRTQGLPSGRPLVRLLAAGELVVAALALFQLPGGALLLAAAYAGFTGFVLLALVRRRPLSSCGCFAEPDLPPTAGHVVVTGAFAATAAAVVAGRPAGVPALLDAAVPTALPAAVAAVLVGWLAFLVLTELPRLQAAAGDPVSQPEGPQLFTIVPARSAP